MVVKSNNGRENTFRHISDTGRENTPMAVKMPNGRENAPMAVKMPNGRENGNPVIFFTKCFAFSCFVTPKRGITKSNATKQSM